jgi:hypothetical protein
MPEARIPEMQLLEAEDWLAAVNGQSLDTDLDYRRAFSALRSAGESKFVTAMQKAVQGFTAAGNGEFPADLTQLAPFFDPPVDAAALDRWKVAPGKTVPNVGVGDTIITQKAPVDETFDTREVLGSAGGRGSTDFISPETREALGLIYDAYRAAHNGAWHTDMAQLRPYATTPEQQAALDKMLLRSK